MVHRPDCERPLAEESDIEFAERDATLGFVAASKRFYVASVAIGQCYWSLSE